MMTTTLGITLETIYRTQAPEQVAKIRRYLAACPDVTNGWAVLSRDADEVMVYMTVTGEDVLDAMVKGVRVLRLAFTELDLFGQFTQDVRVVTEA